MIYTRPLLKKKTRAGYLEPYLLDTENTKISIHTVIGGYEYLDEFNEKNRFAYILNGIGYLLSMPEEKIVAVLKNNSFIEMTSRKVYKMEGQLHYVLVETIGTAKLQKNESPNFYHSIDKPILLFVTKGVGNLYLPDNVYVLREKTVAEIPPNTPYKLNGNFEYILIQD